MIDETRLKPRGSLIHESWRPRKPWRVDYPKDGLRFTRRFASQGEAESFRLTMAEEMHIDWPLRPLEIPIVYALSGAGLVKIGKTCRLTMRIAAIQANSPVPVELAKTWTGGASVERAIHLAFAKYRRHGEWFKMPDGWMERADRVAHAHDVTTCTASPARQLDEISSAA